jgi:hypothetical protein
MALTPTTHTHEIESVTYLTTYRYVHCACGASRKEDLQGRPLEGWHTCVLCTHPWGRG